MNKSSIGGLDENIAGLIAYAGAFVTGIIFLIVEKDSKFVKFHALQSTVGFLLLSFVSLILGWIPFIGAVITWVIGIVAFAFWILGMFKAYSGQELNIPVFTDTLKQMMGGNI